MYLREHGAVVTSVDDPNRVELRQDHGIPETAASCHTAIVDDYVIEGHVPAEAIERLLTERPDIRGLVLPGMPPDAPGMGGDPSTWANQQVMAVSNDGTLEPFDY